MFGDDLLVAPVVERGVTKREVYFPPGDWVDWWTGTVTQGPQTAMVDAPLQTLPLWIRAGGMVPMLRPTIDTLAPATAVGRVDSYDNEVGTLYVRAAPAAEPSEQVLFDGTVLSQTAEGDALALSWTDGDEFAHGVWFEVDREGPPSAVAIGAEALTEAPSVDALADVTTGWAWDAEIGRLHVRVPGGGGTVTVQ